MNIIAVTSMKNEGPHCVEWIAHHLALGVSHFLIYSNDCTDGNDTMLDVLADAGIVTHERVDSGEERPVQWQALKQASAHQLVKSADWAVVIDCDEFTCLNPPLNTLSDLIATVPKDTDAITLRWRLFGHDGQVELKDQLTTERFSRAATPDVNVPLAHFFKTLFRPSAFRELGVHRPKHRKGDAPNWVDGGGNPLPEHFAVNGRRINLYGLENSIALAQLNHYSLRSAESYLVKRSRGLPNHVSKELGLGYWVERNFNTVVDASAKRHLVGTKIKMAELFEISGLWELHKAAFASHQALVCNIKKNAQDVKLLWQLILAGASCEPEQSTTHSHLTRLNTAQETDG